MTLEDATTTGTRPPITVRPIETVAEYQACQEIQRRAWGITQDGYVVPVATMISVQHAGGLVLGAFEGARLAGFAFGYLGRVEGQWALYSQLTGVDPAVQDRGVGGLLKQAQRAWARGQGLALVAWSFDPLQAGNANLNLHRLGAYSHTYQVDYFGERSDALNVGLETDRLLALWPVDDARIHWRAGAGPARVILVGEVRADGAIAPRLEESAATEDADATLHAEIPVDFPAIKGHDPALARDWQLALRAVLQRSFAAGYSAMDFLRESTGERGRAWYVLRRRDAEC